MKTKPFNLEEALNGAKVVTRDGREVKELTKFESFEDYPLVGVLDNELKSWNEQGKHTNFCVGDSSLDLFLAVEPQRIWVCVYKISGQIGLGAICYSKEEAESKIISTANYIKTIEITDEP
jgi:hypothetical protein